MQYRLMVAIFASFVLHIVLITGFISFAESSYCWQSSADEVFNKPNLSTSVLKVGFLFIQKRMAEHGRLVAHSEAISPVVIDANTNDNVSPQTGAIMIAPDQREYVEVDKFLRPSDVDIRAIPLSSVEIPSSIRVGDAAVVFKVRVFIDRSGVVVQINDLSEADFDSVSFSLLEKEIMRTLFFPAKKNGSPVDSYIEVELKG